MSYHYSYMVAFRAGSKCHQIESPDVYIFSNFPEGHAPRPSQEKNALHAECASLLNVKFT